MQGEDIVHGNFDSTVHDVVGIANCQGQEYCGQILEPSIEQLAIVLKLLCDVQVCLSMVDVSETQPT
jgi:hypothetical protein